jgi:hypothetical protein
MTQIYLNNQKIEVERRNPSASVSAATVNELIIDLITGHVDQNDTITNIWLDDTSITQQDEQKVFKTPLNQFKKLNIETKNRYHLAFEALHSLSLHLDYVVKRINYQVEVLREEKNINTQEDFIKLVESFDLFVQSFTTIKTVLQTRFEFDPFLQTNLNKYENDILHHLKSLLSAHENKNNILMADLLEYELGPLIVQWNDDLLPQIANLKNKL